MYGHLSEYADFLVEFCASYFARRAAEINVSPPDPLTFLHDFGPHAGRSDSVPAPFQTPLKRLDCALASPTRRGIRHASENLLETLFRV